MKIPDEILAVAKETVLAFGGFQPMLFVDGTMRKVYIPVPFGESSDERVEIMTQTGIRLAKTRDIGDVERVVYVSEGWVSPARKSYIPPAHDPDRTEVLMFNMLDAKTNAQLLVLYACVRNAHDDIIDLKPVPQPEGGHVDGKLLPAFLAGFRLFNR